MDEYQGGTAVGTASDLNANSTAIGKGGGAGGGCVEKPKRARKSSIKPSKFTGKLRNNDEGASTEVAKEFVFSSSSSSPSQVVFSAAGISSGKGVSGVSEKALSSSPQQISISGATAEVAVRGEYPEKTKRDGLVTQQESIMLLLKNAALPLVASRKVKGDTRAAAASRTGLSPCATTCPPTPRTPSANDGISSGCSRPNCSTPSPSTCQGAPHHLGYPQAEGKLDVAAAAILTSTSVTVRTGGGGAGQDVEEPRTKDECVNGDYDNQKAAGLRMGDEDTERGTALTTEQSPLYAQHKEEQYTCMQSVPMMGGGAGGTPRVERGTHEVNKGTPPSGSRASKRVAAAVVAAAAKAGERAEALAMAEAAVAAKLKTKKLAKQQKQKKVKADGVEKSRAATAAADKATGKAGKVSAAAAASCKEKQQASLKVLFGERSLSIYSRPVLGKFISIVG